MNAFSRLFYDPRTRRPGPLLRGHLLLFDPREPPAYRAAAGLRLLLVFVVLELVLGPRMGLLAWLGLDVPAWLRVPLLLALALLAVRLGAGLRLRDVGFVPWRAWTVTETLYLLQVVLLANAVFFALHGRQFAALSPRSDAWPAVAAIVGGELLWGFYQELMYRGLLQTELTRRFGTMRGVLAANLVFTFGPLHFYHFGATVPWPATAAMLGAIFAIGLLFGVIFHRTRNLWLAGVFHGIGNAWINGAARIAVLYPPVAAATS